MERTPTEADRISLKRQHLDVTLRRVRRPRARAKVARRGQACGANTLASFGMIITLLMIWAMTVNM